MKTKKFTYVLFGFYFLALAWIILFKGQLSLAGFGSYRNVNLVPFQGSAIVNGKIDFDEIIGNIFVFLPFGIFMGAIFPKNSFYKKILPIFLASLAFEILQFVFAIGSTDITDLITNTSGGLIGLGIYFLLEKIFKEHILAVINWISLICAVVLLGLISIVLISNF